MERPFTLKSTEFSLKMTKEKLEYEEEELRQLEKMYKADDITEETEAIVLKRGTRRRGSREVLGRIGAAQLRSHDEVRHSAQGRGGEGGGAAKAARMGEEQGGRCRWSCSGSGWRSRSCECSGRRPKRG